MSEPCSDTLKETVSQAMYKRAYASFKEMKKTKDLRFNMVKTRITAINASASQKEKECPWMWKAFWMPVKKSGVTAVPR